MATNITATAHLDNRDVSQTISIEVYQEQLNKVSLVLDQAQYHQSETPHLSWEAVYDSGYAVEAAVTTAVYGSDHPEVAQVNAATGVVSLQSPGKATISVDVTVGSITQRGVTTLTVFPEPWSLVSVNGAINHTIYDNEQKWTLKTKGGNIWGTADDYAYLYKTINMADFPAGVSIIAKIDSISDNVNPDSMIGLMIRESVEAGSKNVNYRIHATTGEPLKRVPFTYRKNKDGETAYYETPKLTLPATMRLSRYGNDMYAHYLDGDNNWILVVKSRI